MSPTTLWVALGGAIGSVARYWTDAWIARLAGTAFPWGTLTINVVGSTIIGVWFALTPATRGTMPSQLFVAVGVLGGFTTFAAFSGQTVMLAQGGEWLRAVAYVGASVGLCLVGTALGFAAATALR